jgi:hypothetical protein
LPEKHLEQDTHEDYEGLDYSASPEASEDQEDLIMSVFYEQNSPSGVGFETIDTLTQFEDTISMALDLATRISDTLPEEAKELMYREKIPLFRIFTDQKGFWGEWCNSENIDVDSEMNKLLDKIAADLKQVSESKG